jgi:uroporphyrinogen decarboxylase
MAQNEQLTARERVRLALQHRETDRVPIAMVCSGINPPAHRALEEYLQRERGLSVEEYLDPLTDIEQISSLYIGPELAERTDMWGVRREPVSYGEGSYNEIEHYPLADAETPADLENHRWPSPDWFDYATLPARIARWRGEGERCLMITNGNVFESSWYMRGFERMFMDLATNPELAHAIFRRVTDFYVEHFRRTLHAAGGEVDLVFTADDIGSQKGLLMSLQMWEEHIKPYHVRLNRTIHEFGARVIYHTDGSVMEAGDVDPIIKNPKHPYTQLLVGSIPWPDPNRQWGETETAFPKGAAFDEHAPGCKFAPRCPFVFEPCTVERPHLYQLEDGRAAACYLYQSEDTVVRENLMSLFPRKEEPVAAQA